MPILLFCPQFIDNENTNFIAFIQPVRDGRHIVNAAIKTTDANNRVVVFFLIIAIPVKKRYFFS
jgi:hypothetical protein